MSESVLVENSLADQDIIREKAAYWLLENDDTDDMLNTEKFQTWLAESPQHQQIFNEMQSLWFAVSPQQQARKCRKKHRQIGLASLCLGTLLLSQQLPWQYWNADYSTAVGQVTTITLADGSEATLNTNSAINVYYQQGQRKLQLVRGEVFVDVEKLSQPKPFIVTSEHVNAQALGTMYSVKHTENESYFQNQKNTQLQDSTQVTVYESTVQVTSKYNNDVVTLSLGQQVTVNQNNINQATVNLPSQPDWSSQRLIFNQTPLSDVISRLNQYHPGLLTLQGDNKLSERQFTGALPTNNSQAAIELLAQTMNLNINSISPYLVWLEQK